MSYCLNPVLVDLDKVNAAIGSRDAALITAIQGSDRWVDTTGDPLVELVMGDELSMAEDDANSCLYSDAFLKICTHLGTLILTEEWSSIRIEALDECGLDTVLDAGPPIPLPESDDFPYIGHILRKDIRLLLGDIQTRKSSGEPYLVDAYDEIIEWLEAALVQDLDIVLSYS